MWHLNFIKTIFGKSLCAQYLWKKTENLYSKLRNTKKRNIIENADIVQI